MGHSEYVFLYVNHTYSGWPMFIKIHIYALWNLSGVQDMIDVLDEIPFVFPWCM